MSKFPSSIFGIQEHSNGMVSGPTQLSSLGSAAPFAHPQLTSYVSGSGGSGTTPKSSTSAFYGVSGPVSNRSMTPNLELLRQVGGPSVAVSLASNLPLSGVGGVRNSTSGAGGSSSSANLMMNGVLGASGQGATNTNINTAQLAPGLNTLGNYFTPSGNSFMYPGAPGRGQPGSGTASSLSSMFSTASGKDLRGSSSYETDFVIQQLQQASSTALKNSDTAATMRFLAGGTAGGVSAVGKSLMTDFTSSATTIPLKFHDNLEFPSLTTVTGSPLSSSSGGVIGGRSGSVGARTASSINVSSMGGGVGTAMSNFSSANKIASGYGSTSFARQPDTRTEFQIHNEDFPALPGSQESKAATAVSSSAEALKDGRFPGDKAAQPKRGIQTHPDGTVTNIPAGMLNDQFGMVGMVAFLRAIETDPTIIPLALGHDLTTLGLNLNASEKNLYQNFGGPWADTPCRPQGIDFPVPSEYLTNAHISDKLAPVKLNRYTDDLLFYLFYNFGGEMFQLAAAAELYNRDWRYHKEEKCWLTRASGQGVVERTQTHERGTYYVFDAAQWRKTAKEMTLEYSKLEDRPMLPPQQPVLQSSIQQPQS